MYRILNENEDFRVLEIPLPPEKRRELEIRVKRNGHIGTVIAWQGYVLCGYEKFDLCLKYHRQYLVEEQWFNRKDAAVAWLCRRQLKRTDLCKSAQAWLISRLYEALRKERERQKAKDQFQYRQLSPSVRSFAEPEDDKDCFAIQSDLALEFNCHWRTVQRYVAFGRQLDQLEERAPGVRKRVLSGDLEVTISNMPALLEMPPFDLRKMADDPRCTVLLPPASLPPEKPAPRKPRPVVCLKPGIKEMPAYDPDAELNGLTYTISAWCKAVRQVRDHADLTKATVIGRENLFRALAALLMDIDPLFTKLEEAVYGPVRKPDGTAEAVHSGCALRPDPDQKPGVQPGIPEDAFVFPYHQGHC